MMRYRLTQKSECWVLGNITKKFLQKLITLIRDFLKAFCDLYISLRIKILIGFFKGS